MKLLPVPSQNGTPHRLSEPDVAVPSTQTGLDCSKQTVTVILAMLHGLFYETLSSDSMYLAMCRARDTAVKSGVPEKEFDRLAKLVISEWKDQSNKNPLVGMYR